MADKKISALTSASTPLAGTEVLPIVQSSATVKVSVANLTAGRDVSATSIATGLGLVGTPAYTFTGDTNTGMWSPAADTIAFSEGGTEAARITSASLVGIGTTAPVGRLMVAATDTSNTIGSATASINITNIDAGATGRTSNLNFTVDDGNLTTRRLATIAAVYTGFGGGSTEGALAFATQFNGSLSERMRISSSGFVGIGTTTPSEKLRVEAASPTRGIIETVRGTGGTGSQICISQDGVGDWAFGQPAAANAFAFFSGRSPGADGTERMRLTDAGLVGLGTSAPAYQLQLSTDSAAKPSTNTWTIASDSRIKTETGEYTKGLDAVCALRPITYHYNGAAGFEVDSKENISIIAQEAMQHFPECVGTFEALLNEGDKEKTELFNWNGHALTFALVNAVKELKASNDALAARVNQLEGN
jgi:hypothetical protein